MTKHQVFDSHIEIRLKLDVFSRLKIRIKSQALRESIIHLLDTNLEKICYKYPTLLSL